MWEVIIHCGGAAIIILVAWELWIEKPTRKMLKKLKSQAIALYSTVAKFKKKATKRIHKH